MTRNTGRLAAALLVLVSATGCSNGDAPDAAPGPTTTQATVPTAEETEAVTPEATVDPEPTGDPEPTEEPAVETERVPVYARTWESGGSQMGCGAPDAVEGALPQSYSVGDHEVHVLGVVCHGMTTMSIGFFDEGNTYVDEDGQEQMLERYLNVHDVAGDFEFGGFDDYRLVGDEVEVDWWVSNVDGEVEQIGTSRVRLSDGELEVVG